MALPNETIHLGAKPNCPDCNEPLELQVLMSGAGYYIGTICCCGPYSRESHYYHTRLEAQTALETNNINYRTAEYRA